MSARKRRFGLKLFFRIILPSLIILVMGIVFGLDFFSVLTPKKIYSTNTNFYNWSKRSDLKMSKFSIDFLLRLENSDQKLIAIFPYNISAGFDYKQLKENNGEIVLKIYPPEAQPVNIIRGNDGKIFAHYEKDKIMEPITAAFSEKAKDYAYDNGIFDRAEEGTKKFFSYLDKEVAFSQPRVLNETVTDERMNIQFRISSDKFIKNQDSFLSRDSSYFYPKNANGTRNEQGISAGYLTVKRKGNINEIEKLCVEEISRDQNKIAFTYRDPYSPNEKVVVGDAASGFRDIEVYMNNGDALYLKGDFNSEQTLQEIVAPNVLYLAMSAKNASDEDRKNTDLYYKFCEKYDQVCEKLTQTEASQKWDNTIGSDVNSLAQWGLEYNRDTVDSVVRGIRFFDEVMRDSVSEVSSVGKLPKTEDFFEKNKVNILYNLKNTVNLPEKSTDRLDFGDVFDELCNDDDLKVAMEHYYLKKASSTDPVSHQYKSNNSRKDSFVRDLLSSGKITKEMLAVDTAGVIIHYADQYAKDFEPEGMKIDSEKKIIFTGKTYDVLFNAKGRGNNYISSKLEGLQEKYDDYVMRRNNEGVLLAFDYKTAFGTSVAMCDLRSNYFYFMGGFDGNPEPMKADYKTIEFAQDIKKDRETFVRIVAYKKNNKKEIVELKKVPDFVLNILETLRNASKSDQESVQDELCNLLGEKIRKSFISKMERPDY